MKKIKGFALTAMLGGVLALATACGSDATEEGNTSSKTEDKNAQLSGEVLIDGSSTVFPIMEAISEEYLSVQPDVRVSVGFSGTGGGFEKFIAGETDMSNASRLIKDEEKAQLEEKGIEFTELPLAFDGVTVVINPENDYANELTVEELKTLWVDNGSVKKWSDIRPEWPAEEIKMYSPGTDSGTYDYFNEVILEDAQIDKNATLSEDDNVLVQGVAGDKNAIGFFGYAYYAENTDKLKAVSIDNGNGPVEPSTETIGNGEYAPLSRTVYTYVSNEALAEKEQVADYTKFAIENAGELAEEVGYISLPEENYTEDLEKIAELTK